MFFFAHIYTNTHIIYIYIYTHSLNDNNIGDEGARALAEALKSNVTLTSLKYASDLFPFFSIFSSRWLCVAHVFPCYTFSLFLETSTQTQRQQHRRGGCVRLKGDVRLQQHAHGTLGVRGNKFPGVPLLFVTHFLSFPLHLPASTALVPSSGVT